MSNECDIFFSHDIYLRKVRKTDLSAVDKQRYFMNEIETTSWD